MKKRFLILAGLAIAIAISPALAHADPGMELAAKELPAAPAPQTGGAHSVALAWTASTDAAANPTLTYNVYRAVTCAGTFSKISSGVAAVTFTDTSVQPGAYCYQVTAFVNSAESVPSNQSTVVILPAAPTKLASTGT